MDLSEISYPIVIAHRGYKAKYPENTLASFRAAVDSGAKMLELDVTLTRDRKLAVIHDDTLDRTTDGSGAVSGHTMAELDKLDAGSWFDRSFAGEKIPSLEEVLETAESKAVVNIEIKPEAWEKNQPEDRIEVQVVRLVKKMKMTDQVIVSSFEPRVLEGIAAMAGSPAVALLTENLRAEDVIDTCRRLKAFAWNPDFKSVTRSQVELMKKENVRVLAYTVNTAEDAQRMVEIGVDGFFSDDPFILK